MLDPLELELQMVMGHHVGTWSRTQVLCKTLFLTMEPSLQPQDYLFYTIYSLLSMTLLHFKNKKYVGLFGGK